MASLPTFLTKLTPEKALKTSYSRMQALVKPYSTYDERFAAAQLIQTSLASASREARTFGDQLIIMLKLGSHATLTSGERERMGLY